jgi:putative proteasome-type protease
MTYCVGMLLREGLVMITDSRTNAGIDNINHFRKLHIFEKPGEVALALATSGNLSVTQSVVSLLTEGLLDPVTGKTETLLEMPSMFKAAQLVGRAVREVDHLDGQGLVKHGGIFDASILLGGQLRDRRLRLFMVYAAGNFIEASSDTPCLQIGEHKYGKAVLDRAVTYDTELYEALKIGLISMDSTMRSNLAVGLPLDMTVLRRDTMRFELSHRIESGDPYFEDLRRQWSEALRAAHQAIPIPPYARRVSPSAK